MKKTPPLLTIIVVVAALVSTLTSCGSPSELPDQAPLCLGIVIGSRSNSAPVNGSAVGILIPDAEEHPELLPDGSVIVVTGVSGSAAGDPVYTGVVKDPGNSYDFKDNQIDTRNKAISAVNEAAASTPQADVLGAIEATAAALRPSGLTCTIHVLDSGLQTSGLILFQQNLLAMAPEDIVSKVPQTETLAGMTVTFDTLGAVVDPQPALDSESLANLAAIWQGIVTKRGGTFTQPGQVSVATRVAPAEGLPPVDVVPIPIRTIDFGDLTPTCTPTSTTWNLPGDVLFEGNLWDLSDEGKALLDSAAEVLKAHPEATASIVGHSASMSAVPGWTQLSENRANAVKIHLVSQGVIESQIVEAYGVGDTQPSSCEDWDPITGTQIEPCASQERTIDLVVSGVVLCD